MRAVTPYVASSYKRGRGSLLMLRWPAPPKPWKRLGLLPSTPFDQPHMLRRHPPRHADRPEVLNQLLRLGGPEQDRTHVFRFAASTREPSAPRCIAAAAPRSWSKHAPVQRARRGAAHLAEVRATGSGIRRTQRGSRSHGACMCSSETQLSITNGQLTITHLVDLSILVPLAQHGLQPAVALGVQPRLLGDALIVLSRQQARGQRRPYRRANVVRGAGTAARTQPPRAAFQTCGTGVAEENQHGAE